MNGVGSYYLVLQKPVTCPDHRPGVLHAPSLCCSLSTDRYLPSSPRFGVLHTHKCQPVGMTVSPLRNVHEHSDTESELARANPRITWCLLDPGRPGSDRDRILHTTSNVTIRALNRHLQGCYGCGSATPHTRCEDTPPALGRPLNEAKSNALQHRPSLTRTHQHQY